MVDLTPALLMIGILNAFAISTVFLFVQEYGSPGAGFINLSLEPFDTVQKLIGISKT
jgi:hypothetical protein